MLATSPPCASQGRTNPATPQLKRKRSESCDSVSPQEAPAATKPLLHAATDNSTGVNQGSPTVNNSTPTAPAASDRSATPRTSDVSKLRETLESQLSLEVLLKHNELRLIDQEMAKCQVALEQLRRCAEIPYPGSAVAGVSQSVSDGTGAPVLHPGNGPAPLSPAPWGVTDGAYTRHYSRWLIPDPRFDGGVPDAGPPLTAGAGPPLIGGRTTRANPGDGGDRPRRGSGGLRLQSLPNGYPPPKEKSGPMLIRRKSDGILVKLICLDCRRDNFSSTQGFINHCRIAHNRNFASHDAAAVASGEPVEVDEAGSVVGGKPALNDASGHVHPLVRSAHAIESSPSRGSSHETFKDSATPQKSPETEQSSAVETPRFSTGSRRTGSSPSGTEKASSHPFTASPETPHLSSLMQVKGVGMDLGQLVGDAKTGVDFEAYSDEGESDDDTAQPSAGVSHGQPLGARGGRQPMRTTVSQAAPQRPNSRKGRGGDHHKPHPLRALAPSQNGSYTSPYATLPGPTQSDEGQEADGGYPSANLSPNTIELNQAPSLVSDDDDYEVAVDSESPSPNSSEAGDHDRDLDHVNVEDDEDTASARATTDPKANPELAGAQHTGPLAKPLRRGSMKENDGFASSRMVRLPGDDDEKHVSSVSPRSSPTNERGHSRRPSQT